MEPLETNYFKEYVRAFNELYTYPLSDIPNSSLPDSVYSVTHGNLCRYTKDLLDALVLFRNRFMEGQQHILEDIALLHALIEYEAAKKTYDYSQYENLKKLVSNLKKSYDAVCKLVETQDFTHL